MANNYFAGFTHGGTQYSAQPATAYAAPAAQTAYVQPAAQTAYAAAPRAQTYDAYQSTHSTAGQYAYTAARTQAAPTYDTSKTYYTPAAAAPAAAVTAVYTVAEPAYQAAKPTYTSTSYSAPTQPRAPISSKPQSQTPASTASYAYQSSTTTATSRTSAGARSGYDAAVYSAATNYYQHSKPSGSSATGVSSSGGSTVSSGGGTGSSAPWQKKPYQQKMGGMQKKMPPKPPQLHYCEVCKISCAGPQTYREHLEGQKHKKKEAAAKAAAPTVVTRAALNQLRCELCDVSCTGADAYAAHIRGAKHQKVLKLHTKLGKPIPSADPVVLSNTSTAKTTSSTGSAAATSTQRVASRPGAAATVTPSATATVKKVIATPKITFVGGTQLKTTGVKAEEVKKVDAIETASAASVDDDKDDILNIPGEKDVQPVGLEYVEDIRNELGAINFYCKLCECKFNDPNAKLMHVKGRRHRLAYKKKVDPSLQVEMKPSIFGRKKQEEKLRRQAAKEEYWRRRDAEERWRMEWEQRRYEEELHQWQRMGGGRGAPFGQGPMGMRRPDTSDDRHVMAKHASIYPNDQELQAVQNIVSSCEKSLKLVSDFLAVSYGEAPKPMDMDKKEVKKETTPAATTAAAAVKKGEATTDAAKKEEKKDGDKEKEDAASAAPRALKGVMRVGVLAKGLLLHGDLNVHLVVLCSEKPTRTLLERVADNLPKQLSGLSEDKYEVKICVEDAAVIVSNDKEPSTSCTITLTSPIMREENMPDSSAAATTPAAAGESVAVTKADPPDVLDRQKCLDALAALRHAKWFQARANGLQSCVVVIRILRDLCQRVPTWTPLNQWAMELLVEKCVSSGGTSMSPGDALRRVFEALASGILLPGGPGLYDPCEKDATDAASTLTNQEREDITASAQHALRLITFRQIHKVLGMEQLPQPKFARKGANPRKRRRTNSQGEGPDDGEGKKDKKEGDEGKMETVGDGAQQA